MKPRGRLRSCVLFLVVLLTISQVNPGFSREVHSESRSPSPSKVEGGLSLSQLKDRLDHKQQSMFAKDYKPQSQEKQGETTYPMGTTAALDVYEPNDTPEQAASIPLNTTINATLYPQDDFDFYNVTVPQDGILSVTFQSSVQDGVLALYNEVGDLVGFADYEDAGRPEQISKNVRAGTYFILAFDYFGEANSVSYSLTTSFSAGLADPYEPNDTLAEAPQIPVEVDIKARIYPFGDEDYYKIIIPGTRTTEIILKSSSVMKGVLALINEDGTEILAFANAEFFGGEVNIRLALQPGTYYVAVLDYNYYYSHTQEYTLRVNCDLTPPTVTETHPANGEQEGFIDDPILITFSEPIQPDSNYQDILIQDSHGRGVPRGLGIKGRVLTITPESILAYTETYTVTLPPGSLQDMEGNKLAQAYSFTFKTQADTPVPVVVSTNPPHQNEGFYPGDSISIIFERVVTPGEHFTNIAVKENHLDPIPINASIQGRKLVIKPIFGLTENTAYQVVVPPDAVTNLSGASLREEYSFSFTTGIGVTPKVIPLPFEVADIVVDPDNPVAFLTSKAEKKLYRVNYVTGEINFLTFPYMTESLELGQGDYIRELYLALLHQEHSYYWGEKDQTGTVAVIDMDTFLLIDEIPLQVDPFDIVAGRDGCLYISSGSGQWTSFHCYRRSTKERIGTASIRQQSFAKLHPIYNRIYTVTTDTSPRYYYMYNVAEGFADTGYWWRYHHHYPTHIPFGIPPQGDYLFNGSGNIFSLSEEISQDLIYETNLGMSFSDIAFDPDGVIWTLSINDKKINRYNRKTFYLEDTLNLQGTGRRLCIKNPEFVILVQPEFPTPTYKNGLQIKTVDSQVYRLYGANRYATAVEVSQAGWPGGADTVLLARGDNFADALAGVPLAHQLGAPILLTHSHNLSPDTRNEIMRLRANRVIILGGTGAVSENVREALLDDPGLAVTKVERLSGNDRYDTARMSALRLAAARGLETIDTAVLAYGQNFPDALAAASYAAVQGYPILLTQTDYLPEHTRAALTALEVQNVIVVGGTSVISDAVLAELQAGGSALRIAGSSRYDTAVALAEHFASGVEHFYISTGLDFPDAIAGAALAAKTNSGILLVHGNHKEPNLAVKGYFDTNGVSAVTILGGPSAVSGDMEVWFEVRFRSR